MTSTTLQLIAVVCGAAGAVTLALLWMRMTAPQTLLRRALLREEEDRATFLFDGSDLIDATAPARDLMRHRQPGQSDWETLVTLLSTRFPDFRSQVSGLSDQGRIDIGAGDDAKGAVRVESWDGYIRVALIEPAPGATSAGLDALTYEAVEDELETLRALGNEAPFPAWKRDLDGVTTWANRAYLSLSEALNPVGPDTAPPWPPLPVFPGLAASVSSKPVVERQAIFLPGRTAPDHYDITSVRRGSGTMHFATEANAAVEAETAQRQFVQVLSRTFAALSVGLAIFDKRRELVMFNPALVTLTGLPVDYLTARPLLSDLLDRLREKQMVPEPADYRTWRDHIAALESAAEDGSYRETWPLSNGRTYRVTGRPHPEGAIAFLFEDISDEISLTRRFRSQIEIAHGALELVEDAVAVFSQERFLLHSNRAYRELWGNGDDTALTRLRLDDEVALWQEHCAPSVAWSGLRSAASQPGRQSWSGQVHLTDGRPLAAQLRPLPAGAIMITFRVGTDALATEVDSNASVAG